MDQHDNSPDNVMIELAKQNAILITGELNRLMEEEQRISRKILELRTKQRRNQKIIDLLLDKPADPAPDTMINTPKEGSLSYYAMELLLKVDSCTTKEVKQYLADNGHDISNQYINTAIHSVLMKQKNVAHIGRARWALIRQEESNQTTAQTS